jgi:urea transport system permease protein
MSLVGAVYGALVVSLGRTVFSEWMPSLWLYLMGGAFILVTMAFPQGLAGLCELIIKKIGAKLKKPAAETDTSAASNANLPPAS